MFDLRQPDGSLVAVRIWGDEYYQIIESLDGYTLIRDPDTKTICYATLNAVNSDLLSTGIAVQDSIPSELDLPLHIRPSQETISQVVTVHRQSYKPGYDNGEQCQTIQVLPQRTSTQGTVMGLCLIVDFPDEPNTISSSEIDNFLNQQGYTGFGNNGSVRDYFYDVSDGLLTFNSYATPSYYTAQYEKSYYDDDTQSAGTMGRLLILEALNHMEAEGFDFSIFDSDDDNVIDALSCLYAGGTTSGWSRGLWPHSGFVTFTADGVSTSRYALAYIGSSLQIGVYCHETGHMVCNWPDLYDTDFESFGIGSYCLMSYGGGSGNPVEPCAFLKYLSGWCDTQILTDYQDGLVVPAGINTIYKYEHPSLTDQYFLIENRNRSGRDSNLPDSGLAIWLVDRQGWNNQQAMTPTEHYEVTLLQADGQWDLENNVNYGDGTDLWAAPDFVVCGPYHALPNTNWWDGLRSGLGIQNISSPGMELTFDYALDALELTPESDFVAAGQQAGPFLPANHSYTVSNRGLGGFDYEISTVADWLSLDDGSGPTTDLITGTLLPNQEIIIEAAFTTEAEILEEGYYTALIIFTNSSSNVSQSRNVVLGIQDLAVNIYQTDFGTGLPDGWTIIDGYSDGMTWRDDNPGQRSSPNLAGPFMIADSWWFGAVVLDEQLLSPVFNCSNFTEINLQFSHYFTTYSAVADVDMRVNGGAWQNVARYEYKSWGIQTVALSAASGQSQVQFRWHYYNALSDWFWGIDDVSLDGLCMQNYPGDLAYDCQVDLEDLVYIAQNWLQSDCSITNGWCSGADLNHSSRVDLNEFPVLAQDWLAGVNQ